MNANLISPYPNADPARLTDNNPLTRPIILQDILNIIKQFKSNSPGTSNISKAIMNKLPNQAIIILKDIFNSTLSLGYFPAKFKHAKIILIPKPNTKGTNPTEYRPISLLEVPGKVLEKIINSRLRNYLETHNILPINQHGFRCNRGTDTALAITTELIADALSSKKQCHLVLRDVSKAFDKVWHNGLKFKIAQLQLPDITTKLLCSFLDNRSANISISHHNGLPFQLHSGVPQGTSLSPTLYALYTSDIPAASAGSTNILYADDITQIVTHPSKSKKIMARRTQYEIIKINNYEKQWKIRTNTSKFKIIPIASKKTEPITVNNMNIPYAKDGIILGLRVNKTGIINHVTHTRNKANYALSTIRRFHSMHTRIKLRQVKVFVSPILTYPSYPLNSISKSSTLKLQRILNKSLRFAHNQRYPYTHTTAELHRLSSMAPLNITLDNRGKKTRNKLTNIIQDPEYIRILTTNDQHEHSYFRKSFLKLNNPEPPPLFTV